MRKSIGRRIKRIDKDVELVKIHICSERANARFTTIFSTSFAIFVGFLVVFWTLFSEKIVPIEAFGVGVTVLSVGTVYEIYRIRRAFRVEINRISEMIETVKKGKELPKLEELLR